MTIQCCVCKKVKDDGQWVRDAAKHPSAMTHTYCPHCLEASLNAMRMELAQRRTSAPAAI